MLTIGGLRSRSRSSGNGPVRVLQRLLVLFLTSYFSAFRFGQTRDVAVYRLLGAGSVEELIYARQIYKQQQMAIGYDASMQTRHEPEDDTRIMTLIKGIIGTLKAYKAIMPKKASYSV